MNPTKILIIMNMLNTILGVYFLPVLYTDERAYKNVTNTTGTSLTYKKGQQIPSRWSWPLISSNVMAKKLYLLSPFKYPWSVHHCLQQSFINIYNLMQEWSFWQNHYFIRNSFSSCISTYIIKNTPWALHYKHRTSAKPGKPY